MKRFWTAMAVAVCAIFAVSGCNDYGNTFQSPGGAILSFLSPSQVPACVATGTTTCPDLTLTLNGSGFVAQTKVQWNGKNLVTTVPTDSSGNPLGNIVTAVVPAALLAKAGTSTVNTINPNSNYGTGTNGLSNTVTFIINNPANPLPTVTSVAPACATVGSSVVLTVTGTNFLNNSTDATQISTLNWTLGASQMQLTSPAATITSTQITATIPAANINAAGNAGITVYNPPSPPVRNVPGSTGSGGGTSTPAVTVTIQAAGTTCTTAAKASANSVGQAAVSEETPAVSLDGRYVAYTAVRDEHAQIFLRDTCEGAPSSCQPHTSMLSVTSEGEAASGDSHTPSMSSDGRYVAFSSDATNLAENPPSGRQIYMRDTCIGADLCKPSTILISTDSSGALVGTESISPSISSSGRYIAFLAITPSRTAQQPSAEKGTSPSPGAANSGYRQVFVRDTCLGFRSPTLGPGHGLLFFSNGIQGSGSTSCTPRTTRISVQPGDGAGTEVNPAGPALSGQAKHVAMVGAKRSTLFTRSVPVDDSVFLAITGDQR
ncbi:MAG TPA: IPT/TIG domain-containing protein [Candidatus Acidoferrum sp.]|nr:IPT/TIG domain-containing protein [Candidatus Acidoferrum sp.]